ncbi:DUF485 domain-containing protein [Nocardiopsis ansamitocini]|uniref:Membrane protein n=1 Tax=Nocardiopsis ansamitocini TaxID=1670832 RepID=A0A9W6P934_9ACTN|nr:DUF485 domain-containing protein [Nocardiopsis ansamitocini]GLU49425.1 membrane protein [Nocardiopsis ansamitocini]
MVDRRESADPGPAPVQGGQWWHSEEERRGQLVQQSIQIVRMGADPRFVALRKRFIRQFSLLVVFSLGWYLAYVFLTVYARDLMAIRVAGSINIGLLVGTGQFVSTFLLAWGYARCAERSIDPVAVELHTEMRAADAARNGETVRP